MEFWRGIILRMCYIFFRKLIFWYIVFRLRKKFEKKEKDGKREGKLENGYRKSREGFSNKVFVKVSWSRFRGGVVSGRGGRESRIR